MHGRSSFASECVALKKVENPNLARRRSPLDILVLSGCFHREHSARAYELIDADLRKLSPTQTHLVFEEHESGPEILVYVSLVAAGLGLAAQVINLIAAIIKARSEGIKKGDHPSDPLHLIVRRVHDSEGFREE